MYGLFGYTQDIYYIIKTSLYPFKINKRTKKYIFIVHFY